MLAALHKLWPTSATTRLGQFVAIGVAATAFGLGHMPQGWGGAVITGVLGLGLGAIMVRHQSIWEAVFAHGFFNATTFVMLYWLSRHFPDLIPAN